MRPFDVIYVANAPEVDTTKVLKFINTAVGTVDNGVNTISDIYIARYNSHGLAVVSPVGTSGAAVGG